MFGRPMLWAILLGAASAAAAGSAREPHDTAFPAQTGSDDPRRPRQCDPNYGGACVPIARDVDCADGDGDGPAYVRGPVEVVGTDIYRLDADGDGIACEPVHRR